MRASHGIPGWLRLAAFGIAWLFVQGNRKLAVNYQATLNLVEMLDWRRVGR